ncbi:MAG: glutamate formimidoyltransferase [Chloroflexota bacterium]
MQQIVECVPNFSEGRNLEIIRAIREAMTTIKGAHLLHETSDSDHNRTVFTLAGSPEAMLDAMYQGIETASQLIDMLQHQGVHPRIGATDVVPFVPIEGVTMQECAHLARRLGKRVGDELGLPIYLYGEAALRPERKSLAYIRRGEFEALIDSIKEKDRYPDYGSAEIGRAGATTIGARKPLIAYNVYLDTDDVHIAKQIAKAIRGSSGGLVHVQALGLLVKGHAQVSMNLLDYHKTPLHRVMELIRIEANHLGTRVIESELIGLMPRDALMQVASWYLQLPDLTTSKLLENQVDAIRQDL